MCLTCHEAAEKAIALIVEIVQRHPSLANDLRIKSDQAFANAEIKHIDQIAAGADS